MVFFQTTAVGGPPASGEFRHPTAWFAPVLVLVFPVIALLGGSTDLLNWGPAILMGGLAAMLLMFGNNRTRPRGVELHPWLWFSLLALLFLRALNSHGAPRSAVASDASLIALAAVAYILGQSLGTPLSRPLLTGLAATTVLNAACLVMQTFNPDWNLIYPHRSGGYPSGLFAHYNYCASFCLGALGLLISRSWKERGWLRWVMVTGGFCALASVPLTLSRGANLALAAMVAISISLLVSYAFRRSSKVLSIWLPVLLLPAIILISGISLVPLLNRGQGGEGFYQDGGRIRFWQAALQLAPNNAWIGGGADSFAANAFLVMKDLGMEPDKVHNEALQIAVDYGYPALIAIALLILAPVIRTFWLFSSGSNSEGAAWEAMGLSGMLVHSNFDFVFHTAPGVFLAGFILGRISYDLWTLGAPSSATLLGMGKMDPGQYQNFLMVLRRHAQDYFGGKTTAISEMTRHLHSQVDPWETCRNNLLFFSKTANPIGLSDSVNEIKIRCRDDLQLLSQAEGSDSRQDGNWLPLCRTVLLGAVVVPMVLMGTRLTQAFADAWLPVYAESSSLPIHDRFNRLIALQERHPYLGIERKLLSAAMACINVFKTADGREHWAQGNEHRIHQAVSGALRHPGVALQLATVLGWSGNVEGAVDLYDQAIERQGGNELLFMAHAFKGQYYYELFLSESEISQPEAKTRYAESAVKSLLQSQSALKSTPWGFAPEFSSCLIECKSYLAGKSLGR